MLGTLLVSFVVIGMCGIVIGTFQASRFPPPEDLSSAHPGDGAFEVGIIGIFAAVLLFFLGPLLHFWFS